MNIPPATLLPVTLVGASETTQSRASRWRDVIARLARLSGITFETKAPEGAVQLVVRGEVAALPLKGVIDLAAERTRLEKEIAKADADIKRVDAKLGNADFMARAPEEVVDEQRERREEAELRREKLMQALERLKSAA
jgi:valyl-tRNA synthetase